MRSNQHTITIFETPINDLEIIGKGGKNSPFLPIDQKNIQRPKYVQEVRNAFKNTTFTFNLYMINTNDKWNWEPYIEFGRVSAWTLKNFPPTILKELEIIAKNKGMEKWPFGGNAINILFIGNTGANFVKMSPWIMAHRIGHVLKEVDGFSNFHVHVSLSTDELLKLYNISPSIQDKRFFHTRIWHEIGKFKSARNSNIRTNYEIDYELFAQYIITGKIESNEPPRTLIIKNKKYTISNDKDYEYAKKLVQESSEDTEIFIYKILKNAVGKIFMM